MTERVGEKELVVEDRCLLRLQRCRLRLDRNVRKTSVACGATFKLRQLLAEIPPQPSGSPFAWSPDRR